MTVAKFQVGDKVRCSSRCSKYMLFKKTDKIAYMKYDPRNECSWYYLKRHFPPYRSYELEKI